jgi:hypothetical protein
MKALFNENIFNYYLCCIKRCNAAAAQIARPALSGTTFISGLFF